MRELKSYEMSAINGAGFWYDVGVFLAELANAHDAIRASGVPNQATD